MNASKIRRRRFCGMNESRHNGTSSTIGSERGESYSMGKCNIVMTFV